MHDIIVIGAGPAGMTAALYALRAGKSVLLFEDTSYGGQIVLSQKVENYPAIEQISGMEFADNLMNQVTKLGGEMAFGRVTGIQGSGKEKKVITGDGEYPCASVIIATGVKHRRLGIPDEDKWVGAGESFCAVCDGAFYKGRDVAVIGGGNTAAADALLLAGYCRKVYIIHRRQQFRAENSLVEKMRASGNIEMVLDCIADSYIGNEKLEGLAVVNKVTGEKREIPLDGIFVAVGQIPDNAAFADTVDLDESGYILAGEDCRTSADGIFAAGDCRKKSVRQLTTAVGDGAVSGLAACEYIDR